MTTYSVVTPGSYNDTPKQNEILARVLKAADTGVYMYLGQLSREVSWGPIRVQSMTNSIKHLEAHGFVKRMYAPASETDMTKLIPFKTGYPELFRGKRQYIVPTPQAYILFKGAR
jgi:hypothetical protein